MDLSRPDSINQQIPSVQKSARIKPQDFLALEGRMDLSRPDSINQQIPSVQKSARIKPQDFLALEGRMDLSRPDSINQQNISHYIYLKKMYNNLNI